MLLSRFPLSHFEDILKPRTSNLELREYMKRLVFMTLPSFVFPQLIIFSTTSVLLAIAVLVVLGKKMSQKNLWLLKFVKTKTGTILVMPPTTSFVLLESGFLISFLTISWLEWCSGKGFILPKNYGFMTLIVGLPLLSGAWVSVFGMLYACPTRFSRKWWYNSARLYNSIFFGIPLAVFIFTVVFMILEGVAMRRGVASWQEFDSRISLQDPFSRPSPSEIEAAASVWQKISLAYWFWGVAWVLWTAVAAIFSVMVIIISITLHTGIKNHLNIMNEWEESVLERSRTPLHFEPQVSFFPTVKKPKNAVLTTLNNESTRKIVLKSALDLIQGLSGIILIGTLSFTALLAYHSSTIYRDFSTSFEKGSENIGTMIVFCGWIMVVLGHSILLLGNGVNT